MLSVWLTWWDLTINFPRKFSLHSCLVSDMQKMQRGTVYGMRSWRSYVCWLTFHVFFILIEFWSNSSHFLWFNFFCPLSTLLKFSSLVHMLSSACFFIRCRCCEYFLRLFAWLGMETRYVVLCFYLGILIVCQFFFVTYLENPKTSSYGVLRLWLLMNVLKGCGGWGLGGGEIWDWKFSQVQFVRDEIF